MRCFHQWCTARASPNRGLLGSILMRKTSTFYWTPGSGEHYLMLCKFSYIYIYIPEPGTFLLGIVFINILNRCISEFIVSDVFLNIQLQHQATPSTIPLDIHAPFPTSLYWSILITDSVVQTKKLSAQIVFEKFGKWSICTDKFAGKWRVQFILKPWIVNRIVW